MIATAGPLPTLGHPFREVYRDGAREVYLNGAAFPRYWMTPTPQEPRTRLAGTEVHETAYRHREFRVRVEASARGWFVVSKLYDPGWAAYPDGRSCPVHEIGQHLMGLPLAAGTHDVRFCYEPVEWVYGLRVTLLAFLGMMIWAVYAWRSHVW